jgi:hypothetical protein
MVQDHIPHSSLDIVEKRLAPGQPLTKPRVRGIAPLQHRMEQQGQQGEAEQNRGEILLAMTKVLLQMRACGLEPVGVFVCDRPSLAPRWRHGHHVVSRQPMRGATASVLEWLARCGVDDGDRTPRD